MPQRRVSLIGSEELFKRTRDPLPAQPEPAQPELPVQQPGPAAPESSAVAHTAPAAVPPVQPAPAQPARSAEVPGASTPGDLTVSLSRQDIETLIDAIQKLKYPSRVRSDTKPPMEEYEALERLRHKLLDSLS